VVPEFVEISIGPPINPTTNVFPSADEAIEPIKLLPALFDTTFDAHVAPISVEIKTRFDVIAAN